MPAQQYELVALDLRRRIVEGEFPLGSDLPSRAQIRTHYEVSGSVADKAMLLLRMEGLTETLAGVAVRVKRVPGADEMPSYGQD